ncbi:MAG TPA: adenylate/guanylate cyclase domain-containing protein [Chitinophagaceae bacterium]|nr:adenylate/guanylate cyclase domain-containing protein [Chitinophagaceae bacterium]
MAKLSLKNIIGKKDGIDSILSSLVEFSGASICIKDTTGKILFGEEKENKFEYSIKSEDEQIGSVTGNEKAFVVADLLNHLLQKDTEKKKLGGEVLNLYKEINLIFNFSEKLAQTIDAASICKITLDEASHVINSNYGAVILWDESKKNLELIASSGELFFDQDTINSQLPVLLNIILNGQSEIVTNTSSLTESGIILPEVQSLIYSALKVNDRVMGAIILGCNEPIPYTAAHLKLLTTLALQSSAAIESAMLYEKNIREAKEREEAMRLVYEATGKFVPYEFIGALGHKVITDVKLGDQVEKIVTVLFSDIRDYTTLSEQMSPEENFKFVCTFNERMGPAIRKHNGFINQYLGDAIMAIFPGNASDALYAAIDMQKQVDELNLVRAANDQSAIRIGVGMHTGPLIMGITGDADRMDATTISDTVNTASRLETLTKHYKAGIILSDACLKHMPEKENFDLRYLGLVQLKGKHESLHIHECFSANSSEEINKKQKSLSTFNEGVNQYLNSAFDTAVKSFQAITEMHPEDQTAFFFLDTATKHLQNNDAKNRTGVVVMLSK